VEARLAALHVAAAKYAGHCLLQAPQYVADPNRWAQLLAQSASMGRVVRGYLNTLVRLQRVRQERQANEASCDRAALAEHCALGPDDPGAGADAARAAGPACRAAGEGRAAAAPVPPPEKVRYRDYSEWSEEEKRQ